MDDAPQTFARGLSYVSKLVTAGNTAMYDASQTFSGSMSYVSEIVGIQTRNLEALRQAQQQMLEGMGDLTKQQAKMLEGTLRRLFGAQPSVPASTSAILSAITMPIEALKTTILESQANSNILTEQMTKSFGPVANTLQSRMMLALDEFKAALEHTVPERVTVAGGASPAKVTFPAASKS
jgi:hypothetical protein